MMQEKTRKQTEKHIAEGFPRPATYSVRPGAKLPVNLIPSPKKEYK